MFRRHYNIVLMFAWIAIAAILIVPGWVGGEKLQRALKLGGAQGPLFGALAVVLAAYNGVKWWYIQTTYRARNAARPLPFSVNRLEKEDANYSPNPELDFFKPEEKAKPEA